MRWSIRLFYPGIALVGLGLILLVGDEKISVAVNTSTGEAHRTGGGLNYLGWGTLCLGFLTLASSHYFKLKESRRADRAEAREVHDRRRSSDDVS